MEKGRNSTSGRPGFCGFRGSGVQCLRGSRQVPDEALPLQGGRDREGDWKKGKERDRGKGYTRFSGGRNASRNKRRCGEVNC